MNFISQHFRFFLLFFIVSNLVETNLLSGAVAEVNYNADQPSISLIQNPNVRSKSTRKMTKNLDCSNEELRKIMHRTISVNGMTESKREIYNTIKEEFEGTWSVICAPCPFSYLAHTHDYCIHSRYGITCLLFKDE